ncbi:hypothetical protein K470DRAFT_255939 [Piedraia hortae CBS 480.64]|uniref:Uncharacterized protein n=1 Tax=Piedraia hortae CBS 480.64 TaxID=1314780 RepID=A0A6A7C4X9_9PEZI|nr:hypothetical protein K470DRAFT_255939 [Piedraia hortae CBS 480.64]
MNLPDPVERPRTMKTGDPMNIDRMNAVLTQASGQRLCTQAFRDRKEGTPYFTCGDLGYGWPQCPHRDFKVWKLW